MNGNYCKSKLLTGGTSILLLCAIFSSVLALADGQTTTVRPRTLPDAGFFVETDDEGNTIEGGKRHYIIPANELSTHYIKGFSTEIFTDESGSHIRLHGFIPRACVNNIQITQVRAATNPTSYHFSIVGVDADGEAAGSWRTCFNNWYNNQNKCPRDGTCVEIGSSGVAGLNTLSELSLDGSGPVNLRVESADETGHPTDTRLASFTSEADLERAEQQERLAALCSSARNGRRSDINALREFGVENNLPNAVAAADSFLRDLDARENAAKETELSTLIASVSEVATIAQGRAKLEELIRAGARNRAARTRIGEALMSLASKVKEIDPAEGENVVSASMARFNLVDNVYAAAKRFGNTAATRERNRNALDRYIYAVRTPDVDPAAYRSARQSAENAIRAAALAARKENGLEHPNYDFAQQGAQFFGWQRDYQGNPIFELPSQSDAIANYSRQQAQATRARVDYYQSFQGIR